MRSKELCEICGKRPAKFIVEIEGATLNVCSSCARGSKIIGRVGQKMKARDIAPGVHVDSAVPRKIRREQDIVENYAEVIRKAREALGLSIEELAKKIGEKASYIEHIEYGKMLPTIKVAKKLEKALNVKLIEIVDIYEGASETKDSAQEFTMADIAEIEKA